MRARHAYAAVALLALIGAVVLAGYWWPMTLASPAAAGPAEGELAERTTVCPVPGATGDGGEAVTAFVNPAAPSSGGVITGALDGPHPLPDPGGARRMTAAADGGAIAITAADDAVGYTASVREYLDPAEEGRGMALATCLPARAEWWFVGVSGSLGTIDELLLANPTDSPAVVTVEVLGPAGAIELVGSGAVVRPGEQEVVRVDSLIPGVSSAALHVTTSGGVIAATVRSTGIDGLIPQGAEFIPAAAAPALQHVVPGVPAGAGLRELVLVGGEQDAAVEVEYLTAGGGRESAEGLVPVPAEHVVVIDVTEELRGESAAVRLTANHEITAGVRSTEAATLPPDATGVLNRVPVADYAWTAAREPVADRAFLPLSGISEAPATVAIVSPLDDVTVAVTTRAANGATETREVAVPGGSVREVGVPVTAGAASLITVERITGTAWWHAAVVQSGTLNDRPIIAAALGSDPSTRVRIPAAHPVPGVLNGTG